MSEPEYKPMTVLDLANRWQVDVRTVRKWIKPFRHELGTVCGNIFTPRQVKIILDHL